MSAIWNEMSDLKVTDRSMIWNSDLVETLELENLMANAHHHRRRRRSPQGKPRQPRPRRLSRPFAGRDDVNWRKHTLSWVNEAGEVTLDYRPVHTELIAEGIDP